VTYGEHEPWNHNSHYHRVILAAVPPGCERALDVGCGQGALTRRLRRVAGEVIGMDRDERSIEIARAHPQAQGITYVLGDFLTAPVEIAPVEIAPEDAMSAQTAPAAAGSLRPGSFDLVTAVASVHHMDTEAALRRMAELLRPGGVLAVVGLAAGVSPASLGLLIPATIAHRVHRVASAQRVESAQAYQSPIVWPPALTYQQVRRLAARVLPGVRFRHRLYWRYSLIWIKSP
jgi:2-polyprenyl-3-methyl-5-hydroxy-6-metoxy-1,4-benzoquinol methylase